MRTERVELLAPAGNADAFYGAINAGADAVYLGGEKFGARAYAENFHTEELITCIRYAHLFGRKVYLTVNTLVKESEFSELYDYLKPFYENGLDGVIVQDFGAFWYVRKQFPDMELHVSTQMTVCSSYGASLLKKMGADRIVPARELSLKEIASIRARSEIALETFIHGAMCYCYSGQCLFSSILGGRSGNRGRCAQPCRLPYSVACGKESVQNVYPLSLKDMCTIEHIPAFIRAGIDSFKIEGRMKKAEYAAGVTAVYRKYIDKYYDGEAYQVSEDDAKLLSELYIRSERQDGYYYKHNAREMITLFSPSYNGENPALEERIRGAYLKEIPRKRVNMRAEFRTGMPAVLRLDAEGVTAEVSGGIVNAALNQPVSADNIKKQLTKLGNTFFAADSVEIYSSEDAFYSLKGINELRREAVAKLEEACITDQGLTPCREALEPQDASWEGSKPGAKAVSGYSLLISNRAQLDAFVKERAFLKDVSKLRNIYLEWDLDFDACLETLVELAGGFSIFIALPPILKEEFAEVFEEIASFYRGHADLIAGFLIRSADGYGWLEAHGIQKTSECAFCADASFYMWNSAGLRMFPLTSFCLPYELKASEQRELLSGAADMYAEKVIYGYIPLMQSANCVAKTVAGCIRDQKRDIRLIDRYQKRFPVVRNCAVCQNTIYNCVPLSLHRELSKWSGSVLLRINLTIEDATLTAGILRYFLNGEVGSLPYEEYTTGHEKRGAE